MLLLQLKNYFQAFAPVKTLSHKTKIRFGRQKTFINEELSVFSICEKYDIPVAVHTVGGGPGGTYSWSPKARLRFADPYLIEDVLVKYPRLRIYMMHAGGEDWPEHAIRLMAYYPQLYTDLAVLLWVEPNTQRYVKEFLRNVKEAGYLDRIMFGSDQMIWPYAIEKSIRFLNSLTFLTKQDKEDIFYNNAARFLKLRK